MLRFGSVGKMKTTN